MSTAVVETGGCVTQVRRCPAISLLASDEQAGEGRCSTRGP